MDSSTLTHGKDRICSILRPGISGAAILVVASLPAALDTLAQSTPSAEQPASPIEAQVAQTEAEIERLEELRIELTRRAEADTQAVAARLEEVVALESRLRDAEPGTEEVAAIFDRVRLLVGEALAGLSDAYRDTAAPSEVPRPGSRLTVRRGGGGLLAPDGPDPGAGAVSPAARRLEELERSAAATAEGLTELEMRLRRQAARRHTDLTRRLWQLRLAALAALPEARRERLFSSFEREGFAELSFEFEALGLVTRLQWLRLRAFTRAETSGLFDPFTAAATGRAVLRVVLVLVLWWWVWRLAPAERKRLRRRAEAVEAPGSRRRALVLVDVIEATAPWGVFLLGLAALRWAIGPEIRSLPFVVPLFLVAAVYGGYRFVTALLVAVLAAGARHSAMEMSPPRRMRLQRSVRRVLAVLTVVTVVLAIQAYRLGQGVLDATLSTLGVWLVALTVFAVLSGWRRELADACLALRAEGRWASLLRRTRDRRSGVLVAPAAFLWLVGRAVTGVAQEAALGLETTREATVFLLRRRLERQARQQGYADGAPEELPEGVRAALEQPVSLKDLEALGRFPELDRVRRTVAAWRRGEPAGAFLLVGAEGTGKGAWIDHFAALEPVAVRLTLKRRLETPEELCAWLGRHLLGSEDVPAGREELAARLDEGEPRILVVEGIENLFLARVNGYRALEEMAALAGLTRRRLFWLMSIEELAWKHLRATAKGLAFARGVAVLPPWSRGEVLELMHRRLAAVGREVSYVELSGRESRREDAAARQREGEAAYAHLLDDFAGGNPRVALHYFLRSLAPGKDGQMRVRLFRRPPVEELEDLGDEGLFLLAAVARHGALTRREASVVTRYPEGLVEILRVRLLEIGAISAEAERFRLSIPWRASALRLLRQRNVLIS